MKPPTHIRSIEIAATCDTATFRLQDVTWRFYSVVFIKSINFKVVPWIAWEARIVLNLSHSCDTALHSTDVVAGYLAVKSYTMYDASHTDKKSYYCTRIVPPTNIPNFAAVAIRFALCWARAVLYCWDQQCQREFNSIFPISTAALWELWRSCN